MNNSEKQLTEPQAKLFAELGIPAEVSHLGPNACTCGLDGCHEHQSWGGLLLERLFADLAGTGDGTVIDLEAEMEKMKEFSTKRSG